MIKVRPTPVLIAVALLAAPSGAAARAASSDPADLFARVLPGSTTTIVSQGTGRVAVTAIPLERFTLPGADDSRFAPAPPEHADQYRAGESGWRALLASAVLAVDHADFLGSDLYVPGAGALEPGTGNFLSHRVRLNPGGVPSSARTQTYGSVTEALALQQLESNLAVASSAVGEGIVGATRAQVVEVDPARNLFGMRADVRVRTLEDLQPRLGDITQGLRSAWSAARPP